MVGKKNKHQKPPHSRGVLARILQMEGFLHAFPFSSGEISWCLRVSRRWWYSCSFCRMMDSCHSAKSHVHRVLNWCVSSRAWWLHKHCPLQYGPKLRNGWLPQMAMLTSPLWKAAEQAYSHIGDTYSVCLSLSIASRYPIFACSAFGSDQSDEM